MAYNAGGKLRITSVTIAKKDKDKFISTMNELMNNVLLLGYPDYREECEKIINLFEGK